MVYRDFEDEKEEGMLDGALGEVLDESIEDDEDDPLTRVDVEEEEKWE